MRRGSLPETVAPEEFAWLAGVTTRTVRTWDSDEGLSECRVDDPSAVRYHTDKAVQWLAARGASASPLTASKTREMAARAELRELELARQRGELIYRSASDQVVAKIADAVRGFIQSIPSRWTTRLPGERRKVASALKKLSAEAASDLTAAVERATADDRRDGANAA